MKKAKLIRIGSNLIFAIIQYLILIYVNYVFVGKIFAYEFTFIKPTFESLSSGLTSLVICYVLVFMSDIRPYMPSRYVIHILYIFLLIPFCSFYAVSDIPLWNLVYVSVGFSTFAFVARRGANIKIYKPASSVVSLLLAIAACATIYLYVGLALKGGVARFNLSLTEVYEARADYVNQGRIPLSGYLVSWQGNVLNMGLLTFGLYRKSRNMVLIALFLQLALFALTSFKSFILGPFLVLAVYKYVKSEDFGRFMLIGSSVLIVLFYIYYLISSDPVLPAIFIRRMYDVPSLLHSYYMDFFSSSEKIKLSNSIFSWIFKYPYNMPVTRVISWRYFGSDFGPNVGFIGDAFAHFGLVGIIIFSAALGFVVKMIDIMSKDVPVSISVGVSALPAMSLVNSAFLTMLTHGMLLSFLMIWCFRWYFIDRSCRRHECSLSSLDSSPDQRCTHLPQGKL